MAWDNLISNQTISFSNLANAVNTQVFTQKIPIPTTSEQITKTDANTYVNINTAYTPYSNKSSNQLVVQSNLQQTTFCAENGGFGNGSPSAILVLNNQTILVGGSFDYYSGTSAYGLVNLYQGGVLNVNFPYGVLSASTISGIDLINEFVQLSDGKILCAGAFNKYLNTSIPSCLLKLNEDGTRDSSFPNATYGFEQFLGPNTYSLRVDSNGKIYYMGRYSTYNATSRNNIARLNSDGSLDTSFNPGSGFNDSTHDALVQSTGNVVIIGIFNCFNGNCSNKNGIVRLTSTGSLDATFGSGTGFGGGSSGGYKGYVYDNNKLLIGGSFTSYNGTSTNNMVKLNSDGTIDTSFNIGSGFDAYVYNLEVDSNGKIYAVGNFTTFNGTSRSRICRLNSDGSLDTSFNPGSGANQLVSEISILDNGLIVIGGSFTQFDGVSAIGIAMLSPSGALLTCGYPSPTPTPPVTQTPTPTPPVTQTPTPTVTPTPTTPKTEVYFNMCAPSNADGNGDIEVTVRAVDGSGNPINVDTNVTISFIWEGDIFSVITGTVTISSGFDCNSGIFGGAEIGENTTIFGFNNTPSPASSATQNYNNDTAEVGTCLLGC
jgi:uncharacterized delta-60 repeat protein